MRHFRVCIKLINQNNKQLKEMIATAQPTALPIGVPVLDNAELAKDVAKTTITQRCTCIYTAQYFVRVTEYPECVTAPVINFYN